MALEHIHTNVPNLDLPNDHNMFHRRKYYVAKPQFLAFMKKMTRECSSDGVTVVTQVPELDTTGLAQLNKGLWINTNSSSKAHTVCNTIFFLRRGICNLKPNIPVIRFCIYKKLFIHDCENNLSWPFYLSSIWIILAKGLEDIL